MSLSPSHRRGLGAWAFALCWLTLGCARAAAPVVRHDAYMREGVGLHLSVREDALATPARNSARGNDQARAQHASPSADPQAAYRDLWLQGIYAGAVLAVLAYNLVLALSLREPAYLCGALYAALSGLALGRHGLALQHLWPAHPDGGRLSTPFFMSLGSGALVLLSRQLLTLPRHWPAADRALRGLQALCVLAACAVAVAPGPLTSQVVAVGTVLVPACLLGMATTLRMRGVQQSPYLLLALGGLLLGTLPTALHMHNVGHGGPWTGYAPQIGAMLALSLLSLALAHPFKLAQEARVQWLQTRAAELEGRVQARTLDLDHAMNQLTEAHARLQALSQQDALTGLKNRVFLNERLPEIWADAQRWHQPLSVLMIDVDHFKQVNDRHGHAAGDEALRQVAAVIKHLVKRPGDHAVRYGGEAFLVVLPQTHAVGAAHIAETIRLAVQALTLHMAGQPVTLTLSIGVACTVPTAALQPQALLNAADRLLYMAKREGRNRCALQPEALAVHARDKYLMKPPGEAPAPATAPGP